MSINEREIYETIYPPGSVYISSISTNPNTILGFGTWVQVVDKYIYGLDPSNSPKTEGGSTYMTIDMMPEHKHHIAETTNTTGGHTHTIRPYCRNNGDGGGDLKPYRPDHDASSLTRWFTDEVGHQHEFNGETLKIGKGEGKQEKLLPAYRSFYIWYRTA